ncbi:hypothetical protein [Burkholderia diffusa]|uniref:hypothetical protein n=1 Tax=Burkholderia diffusa TaxID=488732 RepID=UPI0026596914|nr:hypothetical protein [Burkholderia diffusa]
MIGTGIAGSTNDRKPSTSARQLRWQRPPRAASPPRFRLLLSVFSILLTIYKSSILMSSMEIILLGAVRAPTAQPLRTERTERHV